MKDHPLPTCPRCGSTELTLTSANEYPREPGRLTMYVYKCVCGLAFTSYDKLPAPEPDHPPGP